MKRISRKILSTLLVLTLCIGTSTITFAGVRIDGEQAAANKEADIVESVVGVNNVNNNVAEKKNTFYFEGADTNIFVPKSGDQEVVIENDTDSNLRMELPEVVKDEKGTITDNGTVVYTSKTEDVAVTVQALQQKKDGMTFDSLRSMITIKNNTAPRAYDFGFNLPEGYSLVKDFDYDDDYNEFDCGQVFVLDENGGIVNTIDSAWAKDANGGSVKTYYTITGNTLTQVVEFNENTQFPVIADPTSHPSKVSEYFLDKAGVTRLRDKYTELGAGTFYGGIISCASYYVQPVAGVCSTLVFVNQVYSGYKYYTWDKILKAYTKKYARVRVTFVWRSGGKNSAYIADREDVKWI